MKRLLKVIVVLCLVTAVAFGVSCGKVPKEVTPVSLGIPTEKTTRFGINRSPWDMIFHEGKLYIGNGDYDDNAGPINIWCYDPTTEEWENTGAVPDECVSRFAFIDGKLTTVGTDPIDDWNMGNYYVFEDGEWKTLRTIPDAVHNFDMAEQDGKIFAAIGVEPGKYPVSASEDGGATFTSVRMYKDGATVDTSVYTRIRAYNIFVFKEEVYATVIGNRDNGLDYELYKYEDGVLKYQRSLYNEVVHITVTPTLYGADVEYKDKYFIATGYMFVTDDMEEFEYIKYPNSDIVYDFIVKNDKLYSLTGYKTEDGRYRICVWENSSGKNTDFDMLFYFYYDAPCVAFEYENGSFYIGIGSISASYLQNGEILKVDYSIE